MGGFIEVLILENKLIPEKDLSIACALLKCPHTWIVLLKNKNLCSLLGGYSVKIVKREIDVIIKDKSLRLPISKINLAVLEKFDLKVIFK